MFLHNDFLAFVADETNVRSIDNKTDNDKNRIISQGKLVSLFIAPLNLFVMVKIKRML